MVWRYAGGALELSRTHIMGIVNVTPDSFSDGGRYETPAAVIARAGELERQGAAVVDIGAQSTRPGCTVLSPDEEWQRLSPVLAGLVGKLRVPVSVDTFYPEVARRALEAGAAIINDVSGSLINGMPALAAQYGAGLVMMHAGGGADDPGETNGPAAVRAYFKQALMTAEKAGLSREQVCLDIGVGFGKSREGDRQVIAQLPSLLADLPPVAVLCGASRKRVTAGLQGEVPVEERLPGTLALHTLAQWNGARILRVHDVKEAVRAAESVDMVLKEMR